MATKQSEQENPTPSVPNTGGAALVEGNTAEGATKSYLGHDAADLQGDTKLAEDLDLVVPATVKPTTFEGAQPPAGHVNDPTSEGHVGSTGA